MMITNDTFWVDRAAPGDNAAIEQLLDTAFGPGRTAKASYRYRDGVAREPGMQLVARMPGGIVGTLGFWPVAIGKDFVPALLLGPLAVAPDQRGRRIATALMRRALDLATAAGHRTVLLVGDPGFYRPFGFMPAAQFGITMPHEAPARLQVKELVPHALDGATGAITRWGWARSALSRAA